MRADPQYGEYRPGRLAGSAAPSSQSNSKTRIALRTPISFNVLNARSASNATAAFACIGRASSTAISCCGAAIRAPFLAGLAPPGQIRTLQRRLKGWRSELAHKLVFGTATADMISDSERQWEHRNESLGTFWCGKYRQLGGAFTNEPTRFSP
jgi:hypothetical protein